MTARSRRKTGAWIAAALVAASLSGVSAPPAEANHACPIRPVPAGGHWTGGGLTASEVPFTTDSMLNFDGDTLTGTVSVSGGPANELNGTVDCELITFGTVAPGSTTFEGTLSLDGRSAFGTYEAPGDSGTWFSSADPYALTATSTVQPTTISPNGASSWVIHVENSGNGAATLVSVDFQVSGSGTFGNLNQSTVSQGPGCQLDSEDSSLVHCNVGTILPGATESATLVLVSTGGGGSSIVASGAAYSQVGGGFDDTAPPVTISVVAPDSLPPGTASGTAQPGVKFETSGGKQATPANPITVVFKLPRKVAAGTTGLALSRAAKLGKPKRSLDGVTLAALTKGPQKKAVASNHVALGRPMATTVSGPPVPMSISTTATEADTFCGGEACSGDLIHMTAFNGYNDRKRPAKVTITWDKSRAGRGVNSAIFKRDDARTAPLRTLPICIKTKVGFINTPCIFKRKLVAGGDVQFQFRVLTGDPKFGRR